MPPSPLTEDEFRLLAFARAYADHRDQSLVPQWIQEQLGFSLAQLQGAARGLAARGLAEFFEWDPDDPKHRSAEYPDGPIPMNLKLTPAGWDFLRRDREA